MVQLIKRYEEDIDLIYLKIDKEYQIDTTIDLGNVIVDIDKNNKLLRVELLKASRVLNVSKDVLKEDFEVQVSIRSERSDIIMDMTFSFQIDNQTVIRHVHTKRANSKLQISSQNIIENA